MKKKTILSMHSMQINTMESSATMNIGRAQLTGTHVVNHRNQGFGEQNADGVIKIAPVSFVDDSDIIDKNSTAYRHL